MTDTIKFSTQSGSEYTITNVYQDEIGEYVGYLTRDSEAEVYSYNDGAYHKESFGDEVRFFFTPMKGLGFSFFHPEQGGCITTPVTDIKETI